MSKPALEIIEEVLVEGGKRYRIRLVNTNITFNVSANNPEEAVRKAAELVVKLGLTSLKKGE
ncbi:MAG: hypothetical protein QN229_00620 [Desulfurococcaceae archaeon TW002]